MKVKVGDIYTRHSDGSTWRVKKVDKNVIVLELEGGTWQSLTVTSIFELEKVYAKRWSNSGQKSFDVT